MKSNNSNSPSRSGKSVILLWALSVLVAGIAGSLVYLKVGYNLKPAKPAESPAMLGEVKTVPVDLATPAERCDSTEYQVLLETSDYHSMRRTYWRKYDHHTKWELYVEGRDGGIKVTVEDDSLCKAITKAVGHLRGIDYKPSAKKQQEKEPVSVANESLQQINNANANHQGQVFTHNPTEEKAK